MNARLASRLALLREVLADSEEAPLSVRRAMLVVMLADSVVDLLVQEPGTDPLRTRTKLAAASPDLALVLELAAHRAAGPRLVVEPGTVPLAEYGSLSAAEFMVSLYNQQTVPRLLVRLPEGDHHDAQVVLAGAVAAVMALADPVPVDDVRRLEPTT